MPTRLPRLLRHLSMPRWRVHQAFPAAQMARIDDAIGQARRAGDAEICFVVEGALPAHLAVRSGAARDRAMELFATQRVWDTADNSGVLVYVLLADRSVEIVADRGIHARVGDVGWAAICARLVDGLAAGRGPEAALAAVREIAALRPGRRLAA